MIRGINILSFFPLLIKWTEFPAFLSFCAFSIGVIIFQISSEGGFLLKSNIFLVILSLLCVTSGIIIHKKIIRALIFVVCGFTLANLEYINIKRVNFCISQLSDKPYIMWGEIISQLSPVKDLSSFNFKISKIDTFSNSPLYGKIVRVLVKDARYLKMGEICIKGHFYSFEERNLKKLLNKYMYFKPYAVDAVLFADSVLSCRSSNKILFKLAILMRERVCKIIAQYEKPEHRAIIRAVFLAEKGYIVPEVKESFFKSGFSHLLALSGLHAGILLGFLYLVLSIFPVNRATKHIVAIAVLWSYLLFVGFIPSLTRATIMCTIVILTLLLEKKNYQLQSLGVAGLGWLVFSPSSLFDAGFQLSYFSTFGILTLYPIFSEYISYNSNNRLKMILRKIFITPLLTSLSVLITTLPLILYHFRGFSLYGIFGNIFAPLLMSCAMVLFFVSLIVGIICPFLTNLVLFLSSLFLDSLIFVAEGSTKISFSYCKVGFWSPEFILFYYLILIGIITISKEKRVVFVSVGTPLFFAFIPVYYFMLNFLPRPMFTYVTNTLTSSTTTIIWPDRNVWFICSGEESKTLNTLSKIFIPYINLIPNSTIERIIIIGSDNCLTDSISGKKKNFLDKIKSFRTVKKKFYVSINISLDSIGTTISIINNIGSVKFRTNSRYLIICDILYKPIKKAFIPAFILFSKKSIKFNELTDVIKE